MRKLTILVIGCAVNLICADLTGIWVGRIPTRNGELQDISFKFTQDGATLGGKLYGDYQSTAITDGKISGDQINFVVIAPEISCFGERVSDYSHLSAGRAPTTCHNVATFASMLGGSVAGLRAWDGLRAVDYLATIKNADVSRLGVMGISGGGMHAFFSACLDPRIKAAVISGYFCDWRQSILAINHCTCNFVPGLLKLGELSDLAGLIAPRPLLVENGTKDDIFPIEAVKKTVKRASCAWKIFGEKIETDYFEGAHQIHGKRAYDFLRKYV